MLYIYRALRLCLTHGGLELVEVAPGIDIDRDILAHMDFALIVNDPRPMDARIFATGLMGLRDRMAERPLEDRFSYDPKASDALHRFAAARDLERARRRAHQDRGGGRVRPLGHAVYAIVNYRGVQDRSGVRDSYRRMVEALETSCHLGVTRYGMSGLIRELDIDCRVDALDCAASGDPTRRHARTTLLGRSLSRSAAGGEPGDVGDLKPPTGRVRPRVRQAAIGSL